MLSLKKQIGSKDTNQARDLRMRKQELHEILRRLWTSWTPAQALHVALYGVQTLGIRVYDLVGKTEDTEGVFRWLRLLMPRYIKGIHPNLILKELRKCHLPHAWYHGLLKKLRAVASVMLAKVVEQDLRTIVSTIQDERARQRALKAAELVAGYTVKLAIYALEMDEKIDEELYTKYYQSTPDGDKITLKRAYIGFLVTQCLKPNGKLTITAMTGATNVGFRSYLIKFKNIKGADEVGWTTYEASRTAVWDKKYPKFPKTQKRKREPTTTPRADTSNPTSPKAEKKPKDKRAQKRAKKNGKTEPNKGRANNPGGKQPPRDNRDLAKPPIIAVNQWNTYKYGKQIAAQRHFGMTRKSRAGDTNSFNGYNSGKAKALLEIGNRNNDRHLSKEPRVKLKDLQ